MTGEIRILWTGANRVHFETARGHLRAAEFRVEFSRVESEADFRKTLQEHLPEVLLAEDLSPGQWGLSAFSALQLARSMAPQAVFILVAAEPDTERAVACIQAGADNYLALDRADGLESAIRASLKKKGSEHLEKLAIETLRQNEVRYHTLFENSPISLWEEDYSDVKKYIDQLKAQGVDDFRSYFDARPEEVMRCVDMVRILDVNHATLSLYGAESKNEFFTGLKKLFTEELPAIFKEQLIALGNGATSFEAEVINRTFSGRRIPGTLRLLVVQGLEKSFSRVIVSLVDKTERNKVEEEIHRSRQMLQLVLDNIPQRVFWKDLNLAFAGCNKAFAADAGCTHPRELIGKNDYDMPWKENAAAYREDDFNVISTNAPKINYEEPQVKPDGQALWLRTSKVPLLDRDGKVIGILGTYEDITEHRNAEEALRKSEEKYRRFFEEDLSGVYISTPDGRLLACNPTFIRMFGFSSIQEALATNAFSLFPNAGAREDFLDQLRRHKKLERREAGLRRNDGNTIHVVESAFGHFNEQGELVEIKGYIFDDTERKLLEAQFLQAQKMEAVGRLAGGIAHDFNNLLTCINGYADLLLSSMDEGSSEHKFVAEIKAAGNRAANLTRQLLAFSRRQVLRPEVVHLNLVLEDIKNIVQRLIGEDVELEIIPGAELGRIKADPVQIEQVIFNLAVNARDAMPQGGRLTLETADVELDDSLVLQQHAMKSGKYVMLAVSDSGIGMTDEVMAHLYEPFFTTKEPGKGTGLGLSTAYGIIKQSGGFILARSKPGVGSTFNIYLPFVESEPEPATKKQAPSIATRGTETVLIVEDEEAVRDLACRVLEMNGYRVLSASDSASALQICDSCKAPIDLLISDVVMPGMGGPALARRILSMRPGIKVLFVSGYSEEAIRGEGILEPLTVLVQKPFTAEHLCRKVRELLDSRLT